MAGSGEGVAIVGREAERRAETGRGRGRRRRPWRTAAPPSRRSDASSGRSVLKASSSESARPAWSWSRRNRISSSRTSRRRVRLLERPRRVQRVVVEAERFGDVLLRRREAGELQVDVTIFGL